MLMVSIISFICRVKRILRLHAHQEKTCHMGKFYMLKQLMILLSFNFLFSFLEIFISYHVHGAIGIQRWITPKACLHGVYRPKRDDKY